MKRALNIPIVEAEPEEVTEDAELTPNPEEAIQFQDKEPEPGDYVLVEYAGKDKEVITWDSSLSQKMGKTTLK